MSYKSRVYRQRNAHLNDNEQNKGDEKFFSNATEKSNTKNSKTAFFQAKSTDAVPEDKMEKQADQAAKTIGEQPPQKEKKDETIQKLSTPDEDKQTSTNDERMKNDKDKQQ